MRQSAIDVCRIGDVTGKIDIMASAFVSSLKDCSDAINYAWMRSPRFYDDCYIDLACFVRNLKKKGNADIQEKADALLSSLKAGKGKAVLYQGNLGKEVKGTCGLSIYFPSGRINPAYSNLDFAKDSRWAAFLTGYLS